MSLAQLAGLIGSQGVLRSEGGLMVHVKILDVTQAYGNTRYKVTPLSGDGVITVDSSRVTVSDSNYND